MTVNEELPLPTPEWAESWSDESLSLAYSVSEGVREIQSAWADSLDTKTIAVFGVASVILAVVPTLKTPDTVCGRVLWAIAAVLWLGACWFSYQGYRPRPFRLGPNPAVLLGDDWLGRTPRDFRLWRMVSMGRSYENNRGILTEKGKALGMAIILTAGEVLALTVSLFLTSF